jgi:flavin-dependent dehydrogenase
MRGILNRRRSVADKLAPRTDRSDAAAELTDGSRVAVIGGGPSGSFFTYFLFRMAEVVGLDLAVDIFEPRHFTHCGPAGCNHCGGIISESLVQLLATEGINLPPTVVQRGIDSYVLHMDVGSVRIETPGHEKRIAAVFRGNGPRDVEHVGWESFDRFLQGLAGDRGARIVRRAVTGFEWNDGRPLLKHADGSGETYDLVAVAVGVNSNFLRLLEADSVGYRPPKTGATFICEFQLGRENIQQYLGTSMHVFQLGLPRLEFAALIPKGDVVTLCLLGQGIDVELVQRFLDAPEVRRCFPPEMGRPDHVCNCAPMINVRGAARPYADRFVVIGDSGVTRLYKDGIGAAYRTAKAAAVTAVFQGISAKDFENHFWPICRRIERDNAIGKFIFAFNDQLRKKRFSRRAILRMVSREQGNEGTTRHMSGVLWDLFTGSAPYREVFLNSLHPGFLGGLLWNAARSLTPRGAGPIAEENLHGRDRTG